MLDQDNLPPEKMRAGHDWVPARICSPVSYCAVPLNATDCEVAGAATFTFSVAVLAPRWLGENLTFTVHFAPIARFAGQLLFWLNWLALLPPKVMLLICNGPVPVLDTDTAW
jgi:hypothetical protein